MNRRSLRMNWVIAVLGLLLAMIPSLQATEQARIPYSLVYHIEKGLARASQKYTNLQIILRMRPVLSDIKPSDLRAYIDAKNGPIGISIEDNGNFAAPISEPLLGENPWIVVNQPKGTMKLEWNIGIVPNNPTNGMRYRDLMRSVQEVQALRHDEEIRALLEELVAEDSKRPVVGLKLIFPKDKPATASLRTRQGEIVFKPDSEHAVIIPLELSLLEENPEVILPKSPEKMEFATRTKE